MSNRKDHYFSLQNFLLLKYTDNNVNNVVCWYLAQNTKGQLEQQRPTSYTDKPIVSMQMHTWEIIYGPICV